MEERKKISISEVQDLILNHGLKRGEIRERLNLTHSESVALFQHSKLKGIRPKTGVRNIEIIDDTEETATEETPQVEETPEVVEAPQIEVAPLPDQEPDVLEVEAIEEEPEEHANQWDN